MDQDNALIFAEGAPESPQDQWFAQLGIHVSDFLHEAGVPYCTGGVMAKNAKWRGSTDTWRARIAQWIARAQPEDLLSIDIFFDLRGVHGAAHLSEELWKFAFDAAKGDVGFVKALAESSGEFESGIGWFGRLRSRDGRIDLKKYGLFPIVTTARLLAIRHHVVERSTPARLAGVRALKVGGDGDFDALDIAHGTFVDLILAQQIEDMEHGRSPSNAVALKRLNARDTGRLRTALETVQSLNELARDSLFAGS
jgi:DNA polymerase-3 subunit epsilon/CBS domain-containing protein